MWLWAQSCQTAAGPTSEDLLFSLTNGRDHSKTVSSSDFSYSGNLEAKMCRINDGATGSSLEIMSTRLERVYRRALSKLSTEEQSILNSKKVGVILASTKGCIEDFVWSSEVESERDPLTPVLESFLNKSGLNPENSICVSNACASSLVALFLAKNWLSQGRADFVWILACDEVGPFVLKGFQSLKALAKESTKSFAVDRDGLMLGEGVAALLVTNQIPCKKNKIRIHGVGTDTEGFAATRPSATGESVMRACLATEFQSTPDLIIAHGTGTQVNDLTEDTVFSKMYGKQKVPVTSTKWSVGHTLGASAAIDICAAAESLLNQKAFVLKNTTQIDPSFKANYLLKDEQLKQIDKIESILITSLGFGGVHAATVLTVDGDA